VTTVGSNKISCTQESVGKILTAASPHTLSFQSTVCYADCFQGCVWGLWVLHCTVHWCCSNS